MKPLKTPPKKCHYFRPSTVLSQRLRFESAQIAHIGQGPFDGWRTRFQAGERNRVSNRPRTSPRKLLDILSKFQN